MHVALEGMIKCEIQETFGYRTKDFNPLISIDLGSYNSLPSSLEGFQLRFYFILVCICCLLFIISHHSFVVFPVL